MADEIVSVGIKIDTNADQTAAALDKVASKGPKVEQAFDQIKGAAGATGKAMEGMGTAGATAATKVDKLSAALTAAAQAGDRAAAAQAAAAEAAAKTARAAQDGASGVSAMLQSLTSVEGAMKLVAAGAAAFLAEFGIQKILAIRQAFLSQADAITSLNTTLRLATGSTLAASDAYNSLFAVAQRSRIGFTDLGDTFAKIVRSTRDIGVSTTDAVRITETLSKAITLSGVSAESAKLAMIQLGQGMAAGALRGDELNSVMEQTPRVAQAIADGLGVSIGKLREMGREGQLTGEAIVGALQKAAKTIDSEFAVSVTTVGQATTVLQNATTDLIGKLDKMTGESQRAAGGLLGMAKALTSIADVVDRMNNQPLPKILLNQDNFNPFNALEASPLFRITGALAQRILPTPEEAQAQSVERAARENKAWDAIIEQRAQAAQALDTASRKANEALSKFANEPGNLSQAGKKLADQTKLLREFTDTVKPFAQGTEQYAKALNSLEQGLKNIDEKFKPKGKDNSKQEEQEYNSLSDAIRKKAAADLLALDSEGKLTQAEKFAAEMKERLLDSNLKLTAAHRASLQLDVDAKATLIALAEERNKATAAEQEELKARERVIDLANKESSTEQGRIGALAGTVQAMRDHNEQIGLSARLVLELNLKKQDLAITEKEYELIVAKSNDLGETKITQLENEIRLMRERRQLTVEGFDKDRAADLVKSQENAAKDAATAWQRASDDINRGLTDSIFRAAESGKSAFLTLRDSIKGMFANMVLRPIVQGSIGALTGALGLTGTASAATSAGSGLGTLGGLASLGGSIGSFGSGFASGLTAWGAEGSVTGLLGMGTDLFAGGIANGLGTIAGALGPIASGVAAVMAILSSMEGGGPKSGGSFSTNAGERLFTPADSDALVRTLGEGIVAGFQNAAQKFGGSAAGTSISLGFDTDPQGKASNRVASRVVNALGVTTLDNSAGRDIGRNAEDIAKELATEAKRALLAALQGADLGQGFSDFFKRLDPATAAPDAIDNLLALAGAIKDFADSVRGVPGSLGEIANLTASAIDQLANSSGGLDKLKANVSSFFENFFSPQEQQTARTTQLSKAFDNVGLGPDLTLPTAELKAWFRTTVDGIDTLTEAGRNQYASTIALSGPLAEWIRQADQLSTAAEQAAESVAQSISQAFDSPTERLQAGFAKLNITIPDSVENFEALVRNIDTSTTAGQDLANTLIALYPAFKSVQQAAAELERTGITKEMDSLTATFGDLSKSLAELEHPAQTVADRFIELGQNITSLQDALAQALGTAPQTNIEKLQAAIAGRDSIVGAKGNIRDTINSTIVDQFVAKKDTAGATGFIDSQIQWLFSHLAENPADYAARITSLVTQKASISSSAATDASQQEADRINEARSTRMDQLREEIDTFKQLKSIGEDIANTLLEMRTGSLTALAPKDQVKLASDNFDTLFAQYQMDPKNPEIAGKLARAGTLALQESQSFSGSGGNYAAEFLRITGALDSVGLSLSSIPGQLTKDEQQLKALQDTKDATATTADNTGDIITELGTLSTALDGVMTTKNTEITNLVTAIDAQIAEWQADRTAIQAQWVTDQNRWTGLEGRLVSIEGKLATIAGAASNGAV
ncbi:MAG: tape measure protein [Tessaracoccus sp.]|uniref:tape measure protein n=1 Tax=Tessaracoccus sp. TaxID=1971211 RepID=UPI001EC3A0A7|nr:tape measure protein [Tessaracoccus sp.]MBK7822936.1 tape measure protein [Tessaracoccus sp.]